MPVPAIEHNLQRRGDLNLVIARCSRAGMRAYMANGIDLRPQRGRVYTSVMTSSVPLLLSRRSLRVRVVGAGLVGFVMADHTARRSA